MDVVAGKCEIWNHSQWCW